MKNQKDLVNNYLYRDLDMYIKKFSWIEQNIGKEFIDLFEYKELPKNTVLLQEGKISTKIWFLIEGAAIISANMDGEEIVSHFFKPLEFVDWYYSSILKRPSYYSIYVTTNSKLLVANWEDIWKLEDKYPIMHQLEKEIAGGFIGIMDSNKMILQTKKGIDRYKHLLTTDPFVIKHYKSKLVCTLLGLKEESYCRIDKK